MVGRERELERLAQALADERCRCCVLRGPAGTGKTRLAQECLARAEARGFTGRRVLATASARSVPLGAMAALVPPLGSEVNPLGAALRALRAEAAGSPLVLVVDDAQWLDETSAALVHQVVADGEAFGVLTVRDGEDLPAAVAALLRHPEVVQIEVGPLGDDDLATAVRSLVDGEVDPALVERVVALAGGSPLTAHEMFVGAIEAGAVGPVDGRWMALDSLERTPRVTDLVTQRMGRLAEATRRGLGMVALAEPLPLTWVPLAAVAELATLEDAGLIRVEAGSGRDELWVAHPLYGEVLRGGLSGLQRRALLAAVVTTAWDRSQPEVGDLLRLVPWSLELGLDVSVGVLRDATRRAFATHRFDLATRFLEAIPVDQRDADHRFALMSARFYADDLAGGLALLAEMAEDPADDRELARSIEHRVLHAQMAGDFSAARSIAETGMALVADPQERGRVEASALSTTVFELPVRQAVDLLLPLVDDLDDETHVAAGVALTTALAVTGRTRRARAVARRAHQVHQRLWVEHGEDLPPSQPAGSLLFECLALCFDGHPDDAAALLAGADGRLDSAAGKLAHADTALARAVTAHGAGRLAEAADQARRALSLYSSTVHHLGPRWTLAAGFATLAAAQMSERVGVAAALALLETGRAVPIAAEFTELCRAWAEVVLVGPSAAVEHLVAVVGRSVAEGELLWAAQAAWSLARLGAADRVPESFAAAVGAEGLDGDLPEALAEAVAATRRGDAAALESVAARLRGTGALLDAAEALAVAAHVWIADGRPRQATAAARRARELADRCPGLRTPALVLPVDAVALTPREREISSLAAAGSPSRAIAARLGISERTVNNHLQRAYEKLGVSSRSELASALALPPAE